MADSWHACCRQTRRAGSYGALGLFERNDGKLHVLRIRYIRIKSWLRPRNPGITAAEALCAPFFQYNVGQGGMEETQSHHQASKGDQGRAPVRV